MKISKRKAQLFLVDTIIIIAMYGLAMLLTMLKPTSIALNGDYSVLRLLVLILFTMTGRTIAGVYSSIWRYANVQTYLRIIIADAVSNLLLAILGRFEYAVNLGIGVHLIVAMAILLMTLLSRDVYQL